jgi:hypothetical protein
MRTNLGHVSVCEVVWEKCLGTGCSDNETNKVRHTQIIQNIWNIVIKSIWTNIYVIRMNSKIRMIRYDIR